MIRRVELKNWRSHWESEFDFADGTNALLGIMGSGKSSVMDAICFALFGTFPALNKRKLTMDDVIMKRPQKKKQAEVVLELDGEETYTIKRVIERGKGTVEAEIRRGGRLFDTGATAVTEAVERVLETDYDLFTRAVYAEQNALDNFLEIPQGRRKKRVDELLRIDRFEAARSTTTTVLNRLRGNLSDKRELVEEMESSGELDRLEEIRDELVKMREREQDMEDNLKKLTETEAGLRKRLSSVKGKEDAVRKLELQRSRTEGILKNLEEEIPDEEMDDEGLEKRLVEVEESIEKLQKKMESLKESRRELEKSKQRMELSIEGIEKRLEELRDVGVKCPLCEQPIDDEHRQRHIEEKQDAKKELHERVGEISEELDGLNKRLEDCRSREEELENERKDVEKRLTKAREAEAKRKKHTHISNKLDEIEEELSEKNEELKEGSVEDLQDELREVSSSLAELRAERKAVRDTIADREDEMKRLKERKERYEKYCDDVERMKALSGELSKFQKALEKTQLALRREFIDAVNATMSRLWETLYPYQDYTNVRLNAQEDYSLELQENGGGWVTVEGVASGGERTTSLLALRISFALVLAPNLRWLVLDEPTHNLDTNAVEQLAEVLRDHIGRYVDQVFLITHDEKLEDAVTAYLYHLERSHDKNEPTRVECLVDPSEKMLAEN